ALDRLGDAQQDAAALLGGRARPAGVGPGRGLGGAVDVAAVGVRHPADASPGAGVWQTRCAPHPGRARPPPSSVLAAPPCDLPAPPRAGRGPRPLPPPPRGGGGAGGGGDSARRPAPSPPTPLPDGERGETSANHPAPTAPAGSNRTPGSS